MALTVSASQGRSGPSESSLIRAGAVCSVLGIGLSITDDYAAFGKWFAVLGVLLLVVGLHRFGRTGADPARVFEAVPARKKKKKRPRPPVVE